jgi:DNA-binding transcriptional LysR family regulator
MNWDDLRILDTVAATRSLSAAARKLGYSQPKLSRRLRALEDAVGARLFDRLPSGLAPTAAGERMIPLVADMAAAAEAVERQAPSLPESATGTVRISAIETLCHFIGEHMPELRELAPGLSFELITNHADINLSRREADLLIRACLPDGASLIVRRLADMAYAAYGAGVYVAKHPEATTQEAFTRCTWIGFAEDRLFFPREKRWLDERLSDQPSIRVTDVGSAHAAIRSGVGLGLLPCVTGDNDTALVRLGSPIKEIEDKIHLLIHRDVLREPAVRTATDAIAALFKRYRPVLLGEMTRKQGARAA